MGHKNGREEGKETRRRGCRRGSRRGYERRFYENSRKWADRRGRTRVTKLSI